MSDTITTMMAVAIVLSFVFILRWKRHSIMRCICPSEIFLLDSVEERNRVCDLGATALLRQWRAWRTFAIYAVTVGIASLSLSLFVRSVTQGGEWVRAGELLAALLPGIGELLLIPLMFVWYRNWMRSYLREYLNDHGVAVCLNCGYDLRAQTAKRCPECGTKVADN